LLARLLTPLLALIVAAAAREEETAKEANSEGVRLLTAQEMATIAT
jgi:hypothetical protein